ncbi:MAG: hypothetical protein FWF88_10900 [Peptococcaceae bacterium]|nr:hypothetical protein [Peptococcaceae bacterium]
MKKLDNPDCGNGASGERLKELKIRRRSQTVREGIESINGKRYRGDLGNKKAL